MSCFLLCLCSVQMDIDSEAHQMSVMQSQAVFMVSFFPVAVKHLLEHDYQQQWVMVSMLCSCLFL